ncbi:MAG: hypothetical protein ABI083_19470 [Lapillicoccus sp.]
MTLADADVIAAGWAADGAAAQRLRWVMSQHRVAFAGALSFCAIILGLISGFLAATPLSAVEPQGLYVNCGPALLGRLSPLPDPACADAYWPLVPLSVVAGSLAILSLVAAAWISIPMRPARRSRG